MEYYSLQSAVVERLKSAWCDITRLHPLRRGYLNFAYFREIHLGDITICAHFPFLLKLTAYCPPLWYKEGMFFPFFPCVVEPEKKKHLSATMPCTARQTPGIFKCKESPVGATESNVKLGSRTSEPKHMCRTKCDRSEILSFCLPYVSSIFKQTCWNHTYYVLESLHPLPAFSVSIRNQCFGL